MITRYKYLVVELQSNLAIYTAFEDISLCFTTIPSRSIYGCHYDEGRITRVIASLDTEHTLAFRSTLDTLLLEEESGEKIFKEVCNILVFLLIKICSCV